MNDIVVELKSLANPQRAQNLQRFFKTGKGEYGEGDLFIGLKVPQVRQVVKKYWREINLADVEKLLHNKYHEVRFCALMILVERYKKIESEREKIFRIYIASARYINNWDLVDLTAGHIVGAYLQDKPKDLLYKFAKSNDLWQKRIAILATFYYIYKGDATDTIKIAKILLRDKHDLIHKAVGWMLREVGKRCETRPPRKPARRCGQGKMLTDFLDQYSHQMPRTMLRYAIERLPEKQRLYYLRKKI